MAPTTPGRHIVLGELRDQGVGVLDGKRVQPPHIAELLHRPHVRRDHPGIAVLAGAEIARRLEIYESRHLFPVHQMRSSPPTRGRACSGGSSNRNTKRATRGDTPSPGSGTVYYKHLTL